MNPSPSGLSGRLPRLFRALCVLKRRRRKPKRQHGTHDTSSDAGVVPNSKVVKDSRRGSIFQQCKRRPGGNRFEAKRHLPGRENDRVALGLIRENEVENCTVKPWKAKYFPRNPISSWKSNWSFVKTKNRTVSYDFALNYVTPLGKESNAVYGIWTCSPFEYVSSRAQTIYKRWFEYAKKHQKTRIKWKVVQASLLELATFDSVYYRDSDWLQDRVLAVLRFSSRNVYKHLSCIRLRLLGKHEPQITFEVFRRCAFDALKRYHPSFARTIGDKARYGGRYFRTYRNVSAEAPIAKIRIKSLSPSIACNRAIRVRETRLL